MTASQIKYFIEVAECLNISTAASRLYVSQPAVSKQIRLLEEYLGLTLFERYPTGLRLTKSGELFYDFFKRSLRELDRVWDDARHLQEDNTHTLNIGCNDGWDISGFYFELKDIIKEKLSDTEITLNGYNHVNIVESLINNETDIAISLEISLKEASGIAMRNFTSAPAVILISAQNPLAARPDLSIADFKDEPFYVISPPHASGENPMIRFTRELCRNAGFDPRLENISSAASILMRLHSGTGAQITCSWTGACRIPTFRAVELDQRLNISAAWVENDRNPAKKVFIKELCKRYSNK